MQRLPFLALVSVLGIGWALPASASLTYRMVGATCTDSNAPVVYFPDGEGGTIEGAGPKVCANHVTVEVRMRDDYVPGTAFNWSSPPSTDPAPVESLFVFDGARQFSYSFIHPGGLDGLMGLLPAKGVQPSQFSYNNNGGGFFANSDGTWHLNIEQAAGVDAPCGIASTEGPNGCGLDLNYNSTGIYRGWQRVPEPATSVLLLSSVGLMGLMSRRRKGRQPEPDAA